MATNAQQAPWREAFQTHITSMDSPEFVLSTLAPAPPSNTTPTSFLPRARYCIYRGFWTELPVNKHNAAPLNPSGVYASDCITFTTDARMNKTFELFASSEGKAASRDDVGGSGGGGPCEAVWWVKGETMVQWRVKGRAYVVGPDVEAADGEEERSGVRTVKAALQERMRVLREEGREGWSWRREVTAHFGNLSPGMRGTFSGPPPGRAVDKPYDEKKWHPVGEKVEDLEDAAARENFRVVVIKPDVVESVDLSDPQTARRQLYEYDDANGTWSHQELWP